MNRKYIEDHKKSIYLFLLVFISYALVYMTKNCYSAAMTSIVAEGIMTKSQTGFIAAMFYLVYAPFQIIGGILSDKYDPGKLILTGVIGAGAANLLVYFFSTNYIAMTIIWSLNAAVQFGIWPSIFRITATELSPEHRNRGVFFISFASTVGLLLSYITASLISQWEYNFLISAIVLFCIAAAFFFIYRSIKKDMTVQETLTYTNDTSSSSPKQYSSLRVMIISGLPLIFIIYIIQNIINLSIKALAPVMFMESYANVSPALANIFNTILIVAAPLGMAVSRIRFLNRFNLMQKITLFFIAALPFLIAMTFIGKIGLIWLILSLTLLMVITGAMTVFFSFVSKAFEKFGCVATVSGSMNCMASLGIVISNYVFAKLADSFGWGFTTQCLLGIAIAALILGIIVIPIWKRFMTKMDIEE